MAVAMQLKLRGDEAYRNALGRLIRPKADPIYRAALTRCGRHVEQTTQQQFLSGQMLAVRSGLLRASVTTDLSGLPEKVRIGPSAEYAPPLHWGWPRKNIPPHPFLKAGLDRSLPDMPSFWVDEMQKHARSAG